MIYSGDKKIKKISQNIKQPIDCKFYFFLLPYIETFRKMNNFKHKNNKYFILLDFVGENVINNLFAGFSNPFGYSLLKI